MTPSFLIIAVFFSALFNGIETVAERRLSVQVNEFITLDFSNSSSPALEPSPSGQPTYQPTRKPSCQPTSSPRNNPSRQPSKQPSKQPTKQPTRYPSSHPTQPSSRPTRQPTRKPYCHPTSSPNKKPSRQPSKQPISGPTVQPSQQPSFRPTNPSSQPTIQPISGPSSGPSRQPSRQPRAHPTSVPSTRPTSHPSYVLGPHAWYYDTFMDFQSITYIVMYSITAFLFCVSIIVYFRSDLSKEKKKDSLINISVFNFFIWSTFHLVMLCARFDFWLNNDTMYQPYRIDSNGGFIWVDPNTFFKAGKSTLTNVNCKHSSNHPEGYSAVDYSPCRFLFFDISVFLMKEGEVKFSIGCGLIIFIFFQVIIIFMEYAFANLHKNAETPENKYAAPNGDNNDVGETRASSGSCFKYLNPCYLISLVCITIQENGIVWLLKYIFTTLINCQQSLVLLPLTNMNTNDLCVQVITPTNDENAVCLYKYAAYALPNGIIYALYGLIGVGLTATCLQAMNNSNGGNGQACAMFMVFLFALGTAFCAFISVAFIVYYLFAGFFVGLWFQFGVYQWALQTSRPELLSVSLFIVADILWAILNRGNA